MFRLNSNFLNRLAKKIPVLVFSLALVIMSTASAFAYTTEAFDVDVVVAENNSYEVSETVKVNFPALICMLRGDFEPTRAKINGIIKAQNVQIKKLSMEDIGLSPENVGIKGSPTFVSKAFRPIKKRSECVILADINELADEIKDLRGAIDES